MEYYIKFNDLFSILDKIEYKNKKCGDFVRNNFRVLLAKKKLRISDVVEGTGLSRNTVRALYYETAKGVQFDTLSKLCGYLQCDVGDIFQLEKEETV